MGKKIKAVKKTTDGPPDATEIIETHSRQSGTPEFLIFCSLKHR
jgi:hypothetical protein